MVEEAQSGKCKDAACELGADTDVRACAAPDSAR